MQMSKWFYCALFAGLSTVVLYGQMPEVAPGVSLPTSAVSVVDQDSKGAVTALRLESAIVATDPHTGSNIAKGLVYANQHHSIQISGKSATTVLHTAQPSFYVHMPDEHRDLIRAQVTLIRLKPTADTRIAIEFTANSFGGHLKRKVDEVPVEKTDIHDGDWVKVTPVKPLDPGEYGLVFLPQDPVAYSETIYDVSISAK
jgi:hypothetical protein